jgi:hypothetical protein
VTSLAVRFVGVPGIADSGWMTLSPGVSVLTGRNNVGKSRVLQLVTRLSEAYGNANVSAPQLQLARDDLTLTVGLSGSPPPSIYESLQEGLTRRAHWETTGGQWQLHVSDPDTVIFNGGLFGSVSQMTGLLPDLTEVPATLARIIYIPPQRMIPARVPTTPVIVPSASGQDLGQAIYKHRNAMTPQFADFESTIRSMLPEISDILTDPIDAGTVLIRLRDRYARTDIAADEAGTGVSALMHLIATVLFMPASRILLTDEPQLHLHPGAEKLLARFIRAHPEHDYVLATHSQVFVNALEPDRAWLLTRDENGTHINSVFDDELPRAHVLQELGLTPGDMVLAERILLVEGSADLEIYPMLMRRIGWDPIRLNCSVLQLQGGDTARPLREVVRDLVELLNIRILLLLDGDKEGDVPESEIVRLLPIPDIETAFLRDARAIWLAFNEILQEETPEGLDLEGWQREWSAQRIAEYIKGRKEDAPSRKGAAILGDLAHEMGHLTYRKRVHGPRIASQIGRDALEDVAGILSALLGPVPDAASPGSGQ